jgi:iron(III) transport system permease protein
LLWALGALVVIPAMIPIAYLLYVVLQPGGFDAGGFTTARLLELASNTATLTLTVTATTAVLGLTTAWLTTRTDLPHARMWSTMVTIPLVIPSYVGALAILAATGNNGVLTQLLQTVGLPGIPVAEGFWPSWLALSLWNFSFVHLLTVPVLKRLDPALEEVSRGLGASRWRTLFTVVLPQLRPALAASSLLVALYVLSEFGAVSMLRFDTFTRAIYTQWTGRLDPGPALFLAGLLSVGALVIVVFQQRARGRAALYSNRPARKPRLHRLTAGERLGARFFLGSVVTLALVLPILTMLWWTVRGMSLGNTPLTVVPHATRSVLIAVAAAAVVTVAAIPIAILAVRYRSRLVNLLESVAWVTYSLPHLAVGLAFLVLGVGILRPVYQTLLMLLIVYLAMFLPLSLGSVEAGMRRVSPGLEEVSRSLGVGTLGTMRRVTLPIVRRSMLAGAALVFLSVMKELPATLLLRPTGFDTLPVRIWSATNELFYTQASFAALALIAVSILPVYFFVVRDIHD